eukprot:jgi/Ulvmu1/5071/UM021_0088.1
MATKAVVAAVTALRHPVATQVYTTVMFAVSTALLFADQNLLAPNLTDAAKSLGLNELEKDQYLGGVTNFVFFAVGAPASVLVGYLISRGWDRPKLLWICVVLGEAPCIATIFVTTFPQLLLTRAVTGIAVGGAAPIVFALLSDIYPPDRRVLVSTLVLFSTGAGSLVGQTIAGMSGLDWRLPFAIIGVPSIAVATLMVLTTRDPQRGAAEPALQEAFADETFEYDERLTWHKFKVLIRVPTNFLVIGQGGFGCWAWGVVLAYLNDYLAEEGLTKTAATAVFMVFSIGNAFGGILGGVAGHYVWKWRVGALPMFAGVSVWIGTPPLLWLINADVTAIPAAAVYAIAFIAGVTASVAGVEIRPLLMNCNEPEARGIVLALQATLDDLGKGLGPALVAVLISWMGRKAAFNVAICGWLPCGLMLVVAGLYTRRDVDAMSERLVRNAQALHTQVELSGFATTDAGFDAGVAEM